MAATQKKQSLDRTTLAECVVGEVAILRDPTIDGQLRQLDPGTHVKVWWKNDRVAFVSPTAGGKEGKETHVPVGTRIKGVLEKRLDAAEGGLPQDLDPLLRSAGLL